MATNVCSPEGLRKKAANTCSSDGMEWLRCWLWNPTGTPCIGFVIQCRPVQKLNNQLSLGLNTLTCQGRPNGVSSHWDWGRKEEGDIWSEVSTCVFSAPPAHSGYTCTCMLVLAELSVFSFLTRDPLSQVWSSSHPALPIFVFNMDMYSTFGLQIVALWLGRRRLLLL